MPELKTSVKDKIDFRVEAGAAFTSFGRHGSMFDTYIAPKIRYKATPRVHFSAGVILSTGFLSGSGFEGAGTPVGGSSGPMGNRFNRILVFAEGDYQVSPRLTIGGMVVPFLRNEASKSPAASQTVESKPTPCYPPFSPPIFSSHWVRLLSALLLSLTAFTLN